MFLHPVTMGNNNDSSDSEKYGAEENLIIEYGIESLLLEELAGAR